VVHRRPARQALDGEGNDVQFDWIQAAPTGRRPKRDLAVLTAEPRHSARKAEDRGEIGEWQRITRVRSDTSASRDHVGKPKSQRRRSRKLHTPGAAATLATHERQDADTGLGEVAGDRCSEL